MAKPSRNSIWPRENPVAEYIPYSSLVDRYTVLTKGGDFLQVLRLDGLSHESMDPEDIIIAKNQLNELFKNIAGPEVAVWTHIVRREANQFPGGKYDCSFTHGLNEKYRAHMKQTRMMANELYITIILRPVGLESVGFLSKFNKVSKEQEQQNQQASLEKIHEMTSIVKSALGAYNPHLLDCYRNAEKTVFSETLEFLAFLINGEWQPMPLPRGVLSEYLPTSRPFFGREAFELRSLTDSLYGAIVTVKEYPESTEPGVLNALLSAPFPLVLSQSFTFLSRPVATELLKRQQDRMINAGDLAESQIAEISDALDDLTAGRFVMGNHHLTLAAFAEDMDTLKKSLSGARWALAEGGMVIAREDLALEAAFWSQLPANYKFRPRPAPVSSFNLAGFSSFHNYPTGHRSGNQWGPAATMFKTVSGGPYYFNFHEALDKQKKKAAPGKALNEEAEGKGQQKALGNTLVIGPSGSGKTVVQAFALAQSQKFKPTTFVFDKDRGLEIFVRSIGGNYLPLLTGKPTGFNPFQLEPTPGNIMFLQQLVKSLVESENYSISVQEEKEIANAVESVMLRLEKPLRKLSALAGYLQTRSQEGASARLGRWVGQGALAWVFDNDQDELDFSNKRTFGFDITEFLDNDEIRTPVVMYLFHRMESLIDGRRFICVMDEFWKMLLDAYFEDFAQNKLKTIRKQDGIMVFGTQSPQDALRSRIAHSIIEQCATMVLMPNPKADFDDYVKGLKLTEREFAIIKTDLLPGSRQFLIKQGHQSVVAELNLKGFDDELAVLSGTTDNVLLLESVIEQHGSDPKVFLPAFQAARRGQ